MKLLPVHPASCHCSAIKFEVDLPGGLDQPSRCDCSFCRRKGAIVAGVPLDGLRILAGNEFLGIYQFGTRTAIHHFCARCGIYTHHRRRSNPRQYGFNVACLEGVNPFELGDVPTNDGINHPSDR